MLCPSYLCHIKISKPSQFCDFSSAIPPVWKFLLHFLCPMHQFLFLKTLRMKDKCKSLYLWLDNDFFYMTPKTQARKEISKCNFIKINIFLCFKGHHLKSEKITHRRRETLQIIFLIRF